MSGFLKLEGIDGESGDPQHRGEFDIDDMHFGAGGIFGRNPVPEKFPILNIQRRPGKDSGKLLTACAAGTIYPNGKITLDVGHNGKTVTMSNISIRSYSTSGNSQERGESIELSVEKDSIDTVK